eukprot:TRINITY_DN2702_c0_g2_i1.p1 TRINITY_DN2702_c0_g2~~TRINITY_DN2702_c0_g2_i1.p1  ORF type:complete len:495 (+),score=173.65 TRINITY_DN2702_c0_g2_i1:185-1669(+)
MLLRRAVVAVVALAAAPALAGNFTLTVADDGRRVMDLGVFGFSASGVLELQVERLSMREQDCCTPDRADEHIGFTLDYVLSALYARKMRNYGKGEEAQQKICFIQDPKSAWQAEPVPGWRTTFPLEKHLVSEGGVRRVVFSHRITSPGLYALFFYNCKGYSEKGSKLQNRPVTYKVRVSQFNEVAGKKDYLSIGNSRLPIMYAGFTFIFLFLTAGWAKAMQAEAEHVHKIHYVMLMLVVLKTLSIFFESMKFHTQQTTGVITAWDVMYYIFLTLKGIFLFLVILLLGTGWSFLKPVLSTNDKHIALAILPLQIAVNIAIAIIEETSEGGKMWTYWRGGLRILDMACCVVVLLPIVSSIRKLRGAGEGKVARNLARLRRFRTFYLLVVGFIYFTRILVVGMEPMMPFQFTWIPPFVQEAAAVGFYLFTGVGFRPQADNPYLYLEVEDLEDAELREEIAQVSKRGADDEATGHVKNTTKKRMEDPYMGSAPERTAV